VAQSSQNQPDVCELQDNLAAFGALVRSLPARRCPKAWLALQNGRDMSAHCIRAIVVAACMVATPGCDVLTASQERAELKVISSLYYSAQHEAVVQRVRDFMSRHPLTIDTVPALMFKAESEYQLGRLDAAIQDYQSALSVIEKSTNNVNQRSYASAYFRLGVLLQVSQRLDAAIATVEAGLRLAPQHMEGQIQYGDLLERGHRERALQLYRTLLASSLPVSEERVVLGIKINRLDPGASGAVAKQPDLSAASFYPSLSIGLLPLNGLRDEASLADVCIILEGSWRMRCEVLEPLTVAEHEILAEDRGQYDADRILNVIRQRLSESSRPHQYILAVTDRDIFGPQTSFVFSWQGGSDKAGTGVLSTSRFVTDIPDYYEPAIMATRRVALQALSSTGRMMNFTRPTDPQCPLAYPGSFPEFQHKRLQLCESDEQQRNQLLARRGGTAVPFGRARNDAYARVRRTYFID
jgi:predicted Zn-dependent protease/predicted negative regulator of RcsB-dependent stress response